MNWLKEIWYGMQHGNFSAAILIIGIIQIIVTILCAKTRRREKQVFIKRFEQRFELGRIVVTRGVDSLIKIAPEFASFVRSSLQKYIKCDWGDTCKEDQESNNESLKIGERILAVYNHPTHEEWKIWIITEWDRSVTTILFPEEY